jgi:hypothetical protein
LYTFAVESCTPLRGIISNDKIIGIYCFVDDLLKQIGHPEDIRRKVSDSENVTTAIVSALYFGGHLDNGRHMMQKTGMIAEMVDKSRFCRRLRRLDSLLFMRFFQVGQHIKAIAGASDYVIDSFPVAVCDNIRIVRCRMLKGKQWRGKQ